MAPVMATGTVVQPFHRRRLRRRRGAVSRFIEARPPASAPARETIVVPLVEVVSGAASAVASPPPKATEQPVAEPPAPVPSEVTEASVPTKDGGAHGADWGTAMALRLSRDVLETLLQGKSVVVRDILLEPSFSGPTGSPVRPPVNQAAAVEAATARLEEATMPPEAGVATVDLRAPQPPPAPPGDGRAISTAFRRFAG